MGESIAPTLTQTAFTQVVTFKTYLITQSYVVPIPEWRLHRATFLAALSGQTGQNGQAAMHKHVTTALSHLYPHCDSHREAADVLVTQMNKT